ncbi:unnamed protein product [Closterium sp. NIES-64]|nr:unnamed protein product [Closterium sp. NIES-64]
MLRARTYQPGRTARNYAQGLPNYLEERPRVVHTSRFRHVPYDLPHKQPGRYGHVSPHQQQQQQQQQQQHRDVEGQQRLWLVEPQMAQPQQWQQQQQQQQHPQAELHQQLQLPRSNHPEQGEFKSTDDAASGRATIDSTVNGGAGSSSGDVLMQEVTAAGSGAVYIGGGADHSIVEHSNVEQPSEEEQPSSDQPSLDKSSAEQPSSSDQPSSDQPSSEQPILESLCVDELCALQHYTTAGLDLSLPDRAAGWLFLEAQDTHPTADAAGNLVTPFSCLPQRTAAAAGGDLATTPFSRIDRTACFSCENYGCSVPFMELLRGAGEGLEAGREAVDAAGSAYAADEQHLGDTAAGGGIYTVDPLEMFFLNDGEPRD